MDALQEHAALYPDSGLAAIYRDWVEDQERVKEQIRVNREQHDRDIEEFYGWMDEDDTLEGIFNGFDAFVAERPYLQ